MRRKKEAVLTLEWNNDLLPKVVRQDREKYKGISRLPDENPEILNRVHEDLKTLSQGAHRGTPVTPRPIAGRPAFKRSLCSLARGPTFAETPATLLAHSGPEC